MRHSLRVCELDASDAAGTADSWEKGAREALAGGGDALKKAEGASKSGGAAKKKRKTKE